MHCDLTFRCDTPEELAQVASAVAAVTGRGAERRDRPAPATGLADEDAEALRAAGYFQAGDVWVSPDRKFSFELSFRPDVERLRRAALMLRAEKSTPQPAPLPGPTARDGVVGMLLRRKWDETAHRLADGAWTPTRAIEHMRAQYPSGAVIPEEDRACLAALSGLAAREACRAGHGVDDACAECAPVEQPGSDAAEVEVLRRALDSCSSRRQEALRALEKAQVEAEALRKRVEELEEKLAEQLQHASEALKDAAELAAAERSEAESWQRRADEAREQGAAEMRERTAALLERTKCLGGWRDWLAGEIRALPLSPPDPGASEVAPPKPKSVEQAHVAGVVDGLRRAERIVRGVESKQYDVEESFHVLREDIADAISDAERSGSRAPAPADDVRAAQDAGGGL